MSALNNKVSYLRARDPSIIVNFNLLPRNLPEETMFDQSISQNSECDDQISEDDEDNKFNVYLRIKHTSSNDNLYHTDENTLICSVPESSQSGRNIKNGEQLSRMFSFTKIFLPDAGQIELFDSVVKRKVLKFINGYNCNLLTYGPSGSGKTYTIVGTREAPGMIPQSLEYLFRSIQNLKKHPVAKPKSGHKNISWLSPEEQKNEGNELQRLLHNSNIQSEISVHHQTYSYMQKRLSKESVAILDKCSSDVSVWISFAEVYNECVYDLLALSNDKPRKNLKVYNNSGEAYIKDLKQVYVANGNDAYCILQYGLLNLNYAATSLNSHSSRSHCIFTISLVQSSKDTGDFLISRIKFCDLAGSERCKKTNNAGSRLNESNNINSSLLVLWKCISSIRKAQATKNSKLVIPFRESKLTQLFHKALHGDENISMIVAINPDRYMFDETIHALNFSAIASQIIVEKVGLVTSSTISSEVSNLEYERQIELLQTQLIEQEAENEREREELTQKLVTKFEEMYYKEKANAQEEQDRIIEEKDEEIEALQEEIEKYKELCAGEDSSVISIASSCDDSFTKYSAKQQTKLYRDLMAKFDDFKQKYVCLEVENEELKRAVKKERMKTAALEMEMQKQKLEIINLQDKNCYLDNQVDQVIRYSRIIRQDFEDSDDGDSLSEKSEESISSSS